MACWLMKTEPDAFSLDDLQRSPAQTAPWDGVRNYQARNYLRDQMQVGDDVFIYHSSCAQPGIVGMAEVIRAGYPDDSAWNPAAPAYDPRSTPENPRWYRVDVRYTGRFRTPITLAVMKQMPELAQFILLRPGLRLSVMPVPEDVRDHLLARYPRV